MNMKRTQQGFTLIELMIVVAIIGILAAVALPAYQDYMVRARISEGVAAADMAKGEVQTFWTSNNGALPANNGQAGLRPAADYATPIVVSLTVGAGGIITVVYNPANVGGTVAAGTDAIQFVPAPNVAGTTLLWTCNGAGTTLPAQYRPAICR